MEGTPVQGDEASAPQTSAKSRWQHQLGMINIPYPITVMPSLRFLRCWPLPYQCWKASGVQEHGIASLPSGLCSCNVGDAYTSTVARSSRRSSLSRIFLSMLDPKSAFLPHASN